MKSESIKWTTVIRPKASWFDIDLAELWRYRDLIYLFVKRNIVTYYKQTVLGPLWIILNPLITTVIFTVVFGQLAGLAPGGVPQFLFYMIGNNVWMLFSTCVTGTASTFTGNASVFGKVYFPRLAIPVSQLLTALLNYFVQLAMFLGFYAWFFFTGSPIQFTWWVLLSPLLLLEAALLGLGVGIIVSAITTKYRDLAIAATFGVQLWMYLTPVVYPLSTMPEKYKTLMLLNPMAPIVETMRYAFLGSGTIYGGALIVSVFTTAVLLFLGIILFSRVEKTFMDTV